MKKLKSIISILFVIVMVVSVSACNVSHDESDLDFGGVKPPEFSETDIALVKNGQTDYTIILPTQAKNKEKLAAEEFKLFFEQSTGAVISISDDSGIIYSPKGHYVSIGETTLLAKSGIEVPDDLGFSGFYIKVLGNNLFITGLTEYGSLYGVYGFLEYNLGVRMYGFGEEYVPENKEKNLLDFDYSEIPTFEFRLMESGNRFIGDNTIDRLREAMPGYLPGMGSHSTLVVLPNTTEAIAANPKWFVNKNTGLHDNEICLTNDDLFKAFVANLKVRRLQYMNSHPYAETAMIGAMDNDLWCECATCKASHNEHTKTGTYVRFVNKVAAAMKDWEIANGYKQFTYGVFAYRKSQAAPVNYNAETDVYTPISESIIPADNVIVRFCPLYAAYNRSLLDSVYNSSEKKMIESWSVLSNKFKVWTYCLNYTYTMVWFNDFYMMKDHYTVYKNMGVSEVFDQMVYNLNVPAFNSLRMYVKDKLLWNLDNDPTALAYDFIDNFYKDGAPYMKEFFDLVNMRFMQIDKNMKASGGSLQTRTLAINETGILSTAYWPYDFLLQCQRLVDKALAEVDKVSDPTLKATLITRIKTEAVSVKYLMLELHSGQFTTKAYSDLIDEFETDCTNAGIERTGEGSGWTITAALDIYRSKLANM